ncbi:MAG: zinc-ribbon domain containing protein [Clostridia bacterium]|nr:zinc-ribbon domain containing protein [Clostridia bacterium]
MFEDKTLVCKDCGEEFVFTAREQEFYESKGFVNEPLRCKPCRDKRKQAARGNREMHEAVCAACGGTARVPFAPREDRPVYCSECFAKMKEGEAAPAPVEAAAPAEEAPAEEAPVAEEPAAETDAE